MLVLLLLTLNSFADTGLIKTTDVGKADGVTIYYGGNCPGQCVPFPAGTDNSVMKVQGSALAEDGPKKAAKVKALADEKAVSDQVASDKQAARDSLKADPAVDPRLKTALGL